MSVKERLKEFINYKGISVRSFEAKCGYSVILPEYEPPGFVKGGLHGKLVMLKG